MAGHVAEPRLTSSAVELETQCLLAEATAVVGEEELGWLPGARVRQRTAH
jgi:hypothetical protein